APLPTSTPEKCSVGCLACKDVFHCDVCGYGSTLDNSQESTTFGYCMCGDPLPEVAFYRHIDSTTNETKDVSMTLKVTNIVLKEDLKAQKFIYNEVFVLEAEQQELLAKAELQKEEVT